MRKEFSLGRDTAVINFSINYCDNKVKLLNSEGFKEVLKRYLEIIESKQTPVYQYLIKCSKDSNIESVINDITSIFKQLLVLEVNEILNNENNYQSYFGKKKLLIEFIDKLYNFWIRIERYSIIYNKYQGSGLQNVAFIEANNNFSNLVMSTYRMIEEKVIGYQHRVYRQLIAGSNAGLVLTKVPWNSPKEYLGLTSSLFIQSVVLHPPFITYPKRNKRKGIFKEVNENPISYLNLDRDEWLVYPAKVGESLAYIFFNKDFMSMGVTLSNLFELAKFEEYMHKKPDLIYVFGKQDDESKAVFHYDQNNDIMVGYASYDDEYDYFGYMKKMILTLHNIRMIDKGYLPIHGAMANIIMNDGKQYNIVIVGDSGAGKSESLEAVRIIGEEHIKDIKVIFDDMGTLAIKDKKLLAYGTEIGAFIRLDDLDVGYAYRQIERSVFMNPDKENARIVIPITSYDEITSGCSIDMFLYANNYEDGEELEFIEDKNKAIDIFVRGARKAKGTTFEKGLVESYFANPFGPVQRKQQTDKLIKKYFDKLYSSKIVVGQVRTRLGIEGFEKEGPKRVAKKLFDYIQKNKK